MADGGEQACVGVKGKGGMRIAQGVSRPARVGDDEGGGNGRGGRHWGPRSIGRCEWGCQGWWNCTRFVEQANAPTPCAPGHPHKLTTPVRKPTPAPLQSHATKNTHVERLHPLLVVLVVNHPLGPRALPVHQRLRLCLDGALDAPGGLVPDAHVVLTVKGDEGRLRLHRRLLSHLSTEGRAGWV